MRTGLWQLEPSRLLGPGNRRYGWGITIRRSFELEKKKMLQSPPLSPIMNGLIVCVQAPGTTIVSHHKRAQSGSPLAQARKELYDFPRGLKAQSGGEERGGSVFGIISTLTEEVHQVMLISTRNGSAPKIWRSTNCSLAS